MIEPGIYTAIPTCNGAREAKTKDGEVIEFYDVEFEISEGPHKGETVMFSSGVRTDKAIDYTLEILTRCGADVAAFPACEVSKSPVTITVVADERGYSKVKSVGKRNGPLGTPSTALANRIKARLPNASEFDEDGNKLPF